MKRFILFIGLAAAILAALSLAAALGSDVPAITPADFDAPAAHWFWSLLASDAVHNAWLWVTTTGVAAIMAWLRWENTRKEKVVLFVAAGVRQAYEEYVRHAKQASEDGKLTDDERREAMRQAIEYAIRYAANDGFDLLTAYAKEALPALVESILRRIKGEAAAASLPLRLPLPDLSPSHSSAV